MKLSLVKNFIITTYRKTAIIHFPVQFLTTKLRISANRRQYIPSKLVYQIDKYCSLSEKTEYHGTRLEQS
jgi:uncharacterized membrane protein YecN with MAPEG domain